LRKGLEVENGVRDGVEKEKKAGENHGIRHDFS